MLNDIGREIMVAVIAAVIVAGGAYLLIVKENQIYIVTLQAELTEVKSELVQLRQADEAAKTSLSATRLFVAQAHPDRDPLYMFSALKLKDLDSNEIDILAASLPEVELGPGPSKEILNAPEPLKQLIEKYDFSGDDLATYYEVADLPESTGTSIL